MAPKTTVTLNRIVMLPKLYDCHIHLADPVLASYQQQIAEAYEAINLKQAVVVGTHPGDWPHVLELCNSSSRFIAAIGLHPWKVNDAPTDWQAHFLKALDRGVFIIGEIGLDKWITGYDLGRQQAAFRWQLAQATQRNLAVSIHCLKAIGPLMETLRNEPLPQRGLHLHAYNGPVELIPELVGLGAYFSFNAGQLAAGKAKALERIRAVPTERLLIETDAPHMLPAQALRSFELPASNNGHVLTHPATLIDGYAAIAHARATSLGFLEKQVATNFETYFLS